MKKVLAILMAAILIICMVACSKDKNEGNEDNSDEVVENQSAVSNKYGTFEYGVTESGEYEITKYIPQTIFSPVHLYELPVKTPDGRDIVGIGDGAFKSQSTILLVKIPETYTYIGADAFYNCDSLQDVIMSDSITSIGAGAFQNCKVLRNLTFSKSVTKIESRTFSGCACLTSIDLSNVSVIEDAFVNCTALTSVTVSDKLEAATKYAFMNTPKLQYATDGNGLYLGNTANPYVVLISAVNLNIENCTVNDATKVIADGALANCSYLEEVVLGKNVKVVSEACFEGSEYIQYSEYENMRYIGTAENPYMVALKVLLPGSCETLILHKDVSIITSTAIKECTSLKFVEYLNTEANWNNVIKGTDWDKDMTFEINFLEAAQ